MKNTKQETEQERLNRKTKGENPQIKNEKYKR